MEDVIRQSIGTMAGSENKHVLVIPPVHRYNLHVINVIVNSVRFCVNESVFNAASEVDVPDNATVLTGYGTGGAVALVVAVLLKIQKSRNMKVCTFGSPPVGDYEFNALAMQLYHKRVKISSDPIATQGFGMEHCCPATVIGNSFPSCIEKLLTKALATLGIFSSNFDEAVYIKLLTQIPNENNDIVVVFPSLCSNEESDLKSECSDELIESAKGEMDWGMLDPLLQDVSSEESFEV